MKIEYPKNWLSGFRSLLLLSVLLLLAEVGWCQSIPDFEIPDSVCENTTISFSNTTQVAASDTLSYNWIIENGSIAFSTDENPKFTWTTSGQYAVRLIIENQNGDTASVSKVVEIGEIPEVEMSWNNGCANFPIGFAAISESADLSYSWEVEDTTILDSTFRYTYDATGENRVKLTVTSPFGCKVIRDTLVQVDELVVADFNPETTCFGDTTLFNAKDSDTGIHYIWDFGDGTSDTGFYAKHLYKRAHVYNATLSASKGTCTDRLTRQVVVQPLPDASFTYQLSGYEINLDGPSGNDEYRWTFGEGSKSLEEDPTHSYRGVFGSVNVCLATRKGGCWSEECQEVGLYISVEDLQLNGLLVYPNPSSGVYSLNVKKDFGINKLLLFDLKGKEIEGNFILETEKGYQIDISNQPVGMYFLRLENNEGISQHKLQLVK